MNQRNVSLVGSSFVLLGCLGLVGCGSNDTPAISGNGGSSNNSSSSGGSSNATSSNNGSSVGGKSSSDAVGGTSTASGGNNSSSSEAGGSSSQGGTDAAGGQSANQGGSSSNKGGATGNGGTSSAAGGKTGTGGSSARGGMSAVGGSSSTAAGGSSAVGGSSAGNVGGSAVGGNSSTTDTTAAGATSKPVTPTKVSDSDYKFTLPSCSNLVMDVNPSIGARMTKLMLGTKDVLVPFTCTAYDSSAACNSAGTTFWTSPQAGWDGNTSSTGDWPPVKELDGAAYTAAISGAHLTATGSANSTLGASVNKDFSADDGTCWITILYTIKATKAIQVAPWQISRVTRGGLAFFPAGPTTNAGPLAGTTTTTTNTTPKVVWFDDKTKSLSGSGGSKLIADGSGGWLAYALNGNLLIIKYPDVSAASIPSGEGDVEIYADTNGFIELEVQGPYTSVTANGTLPWTVQMRAVPIPSSVTVAAGDAGLLSFVQEQVAM